MSKIYSAGPSITEKEVSYVTDAIRNAWYEGAYKYIGEFEQAVARYVGRKYALALPSGTSAIHLSLLASEIGEGDEVIVPDFTWVGTSAPVTYVGATPVFVDVDSSTWCITAEEIAKHITGKTKAVYAVDLYGNMPDYDEIERICRENDILLFEDSAQALGCTYKGKKAGSFGEASIFSFHGTKLITTGEGGMLLTDNMKLYEKAQKLANYGRDVNSTKMFWFDEIGYKYKYTSIQAALGLAQIERIDEILSKRREIFDWYNEKFLNVKGIAMNKPGENVDSNYWMSTIIIDDRIYDVDKESIVSFLKERNIECRPVMYQLSKMPAYSFLKQIWKNPTAENLCRMGINLPSPHRLKKEEADRVAKEIIELLKKRMRKNASNA